MLVTVRKSVSHALFSISSGERSDGDAYRSPLPRGACMREAGDTATTGHVLRPICIESVGDQDASAKD